METNRNQMGLLGNFLTKALFVLLTLYLLLCGSYAYSVDKTASFLMLVSFVAFFCFGVSKKMALPKIITPIAICVIVYIGIYSLAVFYASTGNFALAVYSKYISGFAAFFIAAILVNQNPAFLRPLFFGCTLAVSITGIFSIDAASCHFLAKLVENNYIAFFSLAETFFIGAFEEGTRMTSILGSPNVFGGLCAISILLSAYLYITASREGEKRVSAATLGISAISLLYCFSLGSLLSMGLAVILLFVFFGKEHRMKLLFVTVATLLLSFLSVLIGFSFMGKTGTVGTVPLISLAVSVLALYFLLKQMEKTADRLHQVSKKTALLLLGALIILAALALALALTMTKPFTFSEQEGTLRRSVSLPSGDASLQIHMSGAETGDLSVMIESQSYDQASTHTSTILYRDSHPVQTEPLSVPFTVPEDAEICFINISAEPGVQIDALSATDGQKTVSIKTDYRFLPTFMVNRLQGITVNQNAAQRFVFYKDGIKIFMRSPIWGLGPGAFESKILEVQDYYYETNSAHNHYIQTLDEVGILGFVPFAAIFLFAVVSLLKNRKDETKAPLRATLLATILMIAVHASMEFTFSFGAYVIIAFLLFGVTSGLFAQKAAAQNKIPNQKLTFFQYPIWAVSAVALLLYLGQFSALQLLNSAVKSGSVNSLLSTLETASVLDYTNRISHKSSFLVNLTPDADAKYLEKAPVYANDLEKHNSFSSLRTLYTFYFNTGNYEEAFRIINKRMTLVKHNPTEWNETFAIYASMVEQTIAQEDFAMEFMPVLIQYIDEAYQLFLSYNAATPVPVSLKKKNQEMIDQILYLRDHPGYTYDDLLNIVSAQK